PTIRNGKKDAPKSMVDIDQHSCPNFRQKIKPIRISINGDHPIRSDLLQLEKIMTIAAANIQ
ncbi:MAG: hypothetical protein ACO29P_02965, partial [Bacteroidia bacterium]